jgi:hypothetical protein
MTLDDSIATRTKNRDGVLGYQYGLRENDNLSFSRNPNYITEKLLCIKLRKLLRIKVALTITGIILIIPILITGIFVVKHILI